MSRLADLGMAYVAYGKQVVLEDRGSREQVADCASPGRAETIARLLSEEAERQLKIISKKG